MATGFLLSFCLCFCIFDYTTMSNKVSDELTTLLEGDSARVINKNNEEESSDAMLSVVQFNAGNLDKYERELQLPTSIEVKSDSILYTQPGQPAVINFEVTNNKYSAVLYTFYANSEERNLQLQPQRAYISPGSSRIIQVTVAPEGGRGQGQGNSDLVTFSARWSVIPFRYETVLKKVYIHSGSQILDSSKPSISYTYNGDCRGYFEPNNCDGKMWRADITVQDSDSGLLMLKSVPVGLILNNEFIVGTSQEVTGYYRSNCCLTKVDIIARDVYGNEKIRTIDIETIWLSTGEIIAIVLGCILLIILIILIVICIIRLCKKRRSLSIYPDSRPL